MVPTSVIDNALSDLLAADTTTLAPAANANKVHLIKAPFVPGGTADFTGMTEATFTGATALGAGRGTQQSFNGRPGVSRIVQLLEPVGGWHWKCTVAPATAEVIYGYCCTNQAGTVTYGCQLFDTPITIAAIGDAIDIPEVRFDIPYTGIT